MRPSLAWKSVAFILLLLAVCICGCTEGIPGNAGMGDMIDQQIQALSSDDPDTEHTAIMTLIEIGEPAVQPIIDSFAVSDNKTRIYGAFILQEIGEPAIPALIIALNAKDTDTLSICTTTLIGMGKPAVPYLLDALKRNNPNTDKVKEVIVRIGEPALPALQAATLSSNPEYARSANELIQSIYLSAKLKSGGFNAQQNTTVTATD